MLSSGAPPDWARVDIAVPRRPGRLPGISMAGFRQHAPAPVGIAMVAHPSVTLLIDLSDGAGIGYDIHGRHERGSVAVGLLPGDLRATGWGLGECLQIRLEPAAAAAVLGASAELSGTVVALDEVWGRDAGRAEERLRAAGYADQSHLHRETMALAGLAPTAVAAAPWLAIDDVAWPRRAFPPRPLINGGPPERMGRKLLREGRPASRQRMP
ncbi:hypothetical protein DMB66_20040 [Actinoplanes sp. ATCC 53533]|uniref:hypothetical protein n=1 Tax=Actinoplanes sp. ATCC 53533 TaxID=1288362 RepID=UPI000F780BFF|nr:hypothetical protein [Actinoplanes sp. ATCC 53533]RSM64211.1 hypothetical protein DMB66_20040 [Actinoplanes sp. ATCC 53533]